MAVRPRLEFTPHAYPDHALPDTTNMRSQQAKYIQQKALDKLRKALESGEKVNTDTKYFVSLPSIDAHSGDPLGCNACGFAQRIHPLVTQKITELVSSGITDTGEVCNQSSSQRAWNPSKLIYSRIICIINYVMSDHHNFYHMHTSRAYTLYKPSDIQSPCRYFTLNRVLSKVLSVEGSCNTYPVIPSYALHSQHKH